MLKTPVVRAQNDTFKQQLSTDTISNKKVIILLQLSTFRRFAAKYYHLFYWKWYQLIFAVLKMLFWALTTEVKHPWKFLTLYCRWADGGGGNGKCPTPQKREGNYPEESDVRGICPGEMSRSPLRPMVSKIRLVVLPGGKNCVIYCHH